jgi:hypothetical protein
LNQVFKTAKHTEGQKTVELTVISYE